jgi:methyl-accepting chemotaxis protein
MKGILRKFKTLRAKIIIILIIFSLVPVILTGISSYLISTDILSKKLETTSRQTIKEISRGIDNYFISMSNLVTILSRDSDVLHSDEEEYLLRARKLLTNINETDLNIINVYVGTEKGKFYTDPIVEIPEGYNHLKSDWYKSAASNPGKVIITDPYIDNASGNMVISLSEAMLEDGKLIGVVGIDVDLAALAASLSDIRIGDSGYIYITEKNGILISHPDSNLIGTDTVTTLSHWEEIKAKTDGFTTYQYDGKDLFATYETSNVTGWKVIAAMDFTELSKDTSSINTALQIVIIITIITAVIIAILFSIPIARNTKILLTAIGRLSQGDLTARASIKSWDEFQLLGAQFNEMSQNVSRLIRNVSDASITVLDTSIILSSMAEETNSSINEVSRAVEEVARGATEQAQYSSDGAANASKLSSELDAIVSSTDFIDGLSKNANNLTIQGLDRVESLAQKSELTMQSTSRVSELVFETSESMKQIDAISDTIDLITEQTNLLALNASIEAARAGESGKGFAVVANEIRKLAEQSKSSTVKIKSIVEEISQKTAHSVDAMEITNQNMQEQVSLVTETQSVFHDIMEAVQNLSDRVTVIKSNVQEISLEKENIVGQIENISAISQESASATEEVTASTEQINITMDEISKHATELQLLSEQLQERINSFKF